MKYIVTSKKKGVDSKMLLDYNEAGEINKIEFEGCDINQISYLLDRVPVLEDLLKNRCEAYNLNLAVAELDLSFDNFWNTFAYKVGKKMRSKRLWEAMSEAEKIESFVKIPKYHRFINIKQQESAYPETWLYNRMWENEYVIR